MATSEFRIVIKSVSSSALTPEIERRMRGAGDAVLHRMQRLVPKRTWALHDSMGTETVTSGDRITTTVHFGGGSVDYGLYVERGTSRMKAQPFARPALMQTTGVDLR